VLTKWLKNVQRRAAKIPFRIKSLTVKCDVSNFLSSNEELTEYLREEALADQCNKTSVTHLLISESDDIIGYFTLLTDSIKVKSINLGDDYRDFRYRSVPALKIGRLSTAKGMEGKGLGTAMLEISISFLIEITRHVGCRILTVDSKEGCEGFYEKNGFERARDQRGETVHMYLDIGAFLKRKSD